MKIKFFIISMFFLTTVLFSQEMKLYAPFPSRIKAETSGTQISISWKDAKDVLDGSYEIYRANVALTADNLYLAERIGDVQAGVGSYKDTPPLGIDLFYAIFARDSTQVYKICIPYRNVTTSAVKIDESDVEETMSTVISNINSRIFGTDVFMEYQSTLEDRETMMFRSTTQIDTYEKLLKSVNISEDSGTIVKYTDNPMAGIEYYYAAVDKELYRLGSENLLYEGNYTTDPVLVKFSHEVEDDSRYTKATMPLPLLKLSADLESGEILGERKQPESNGSISNENIQSINRLIGITAPVYAPVEPTVLSYNKNINPIISTHFLKRDWSESISLLENYTSLTYDEETRIQSHFYRGQAYYFMARYNKAMVEFIMVEKELFVETESFFSSIYSFKKSSLPE